VDVEPGVGAWLDVPVNDPPVPPVQPVEP
jgi:hypothetical protein